MKKVVVLGGGGHASVVVDALIGLPHYEYVGSLMPMEHVSIDCHMKRIGDDSDIESLLKSGITDFMIGIGDISLRKKLVSKLEKKYPSIRFPTIIHPTAYVSPYSRVSQGGYVGAGVNVGPQVEIDTQVILNSHCSVDHHTKIGEFSNLSPGVIVAGNCRLGKSVFVGMSASVVNGIDIGDESVVGAGTLVLKDVRKKTLVYGVPSQHIKDL